MTPMCILLSCCAARVAWKLRRNPGPPHAFPCILRTEAGDTSAADTDAARGTVARTAVVAIAAMPLTLAGALRLAMTLPCWSWLCALAKPLRRKCLSPVHIAAAMPPARCMVKSCVAVWSCLLLVGCDSRCAPPLAAPCCGGTSFALSFCQCLSITKPAMVPARAVRGQTWRAYTKRRAAQFDQGPDATPRACWMGLPVTGICGYWSGASRTALLGSRKSQSERSSEDARLLAAVEEGNVGAVQEILVAGGSPVATDDWGTTCLQAAVKGGHVEVVRALLSAGADANVASTSDDETTPLHCAVLKGPD